MFPVSKGPCIPNLYKNWFGGNAKSYWSFQKSQFQFRLYALQIEEKQLINNICMSALQFTWLLDTQRLSCSLDRSEFYQGH